MARPTKNKDYTICERIKEARTNAGLTQQQLADQLNIPLQTYKNWEQKRNIPKQGDLKEIGRICNVDATWLMHIDAASIIEESREILKNFNPNKATSIKPIGLKEQAKYRCLIEGLTSCGYLWNEINDSDNFFEFMDSPIESLKNSIELYMQTINPTRKRKDEEQ